MSAWLFNDSIGAAVSFVALILGWLALFAIAAVGFWKSGVYVAYRVLELAAVAKRDLRRVLGSRNKTPELPVVAQGRATARLLSVKP